MPNIFLITAIDEALVAGPAIKNINAAPGVMPLAISTTAIGIDAVNIKPRVKKAFYLNDENKKLSVLESSKIVMGKLTKGDKISLIISFRFTISVSSFF